MFTIKYKKIEEKLKGDFDDLLELIISSMDTAVEKWKEEYQNLGLLVIRYSKIEVELTVKKMKDFQNLLQSVIRYIKIEERFSTSTGIDSKLNKK